jgi:hypothetical protein
MASIGRVKPYVFAGIDPDPNSITLHAPGFPPPQDQPQPSDLYVNRADPNNVELWVFGFIQSQSVPSWERVDNDGPTGAAGPPGTRWFTGDGPPPDPFPGANDGDLYLDNLTGDYYRLTGTQSFSLTALVPTMYVSMIPQS